MSRKVLLALVGACVLGLGLPVAAQAATWSVVASTNPTQNDALSAVARVPNTTQFWAVGSATNTAGVSQPTIVRTTGSGWSVTASPTIPGGGVLLDVAALNTTNAWAVGYRGTADDASDECLECGGCPITGTPVVEHWNGKAWQVVALPGGNAALDGVKVFSASDVLAVGVTQSGSAVAYHWNGSAWSTSTLPLPASCAGSPSIAAAVAALPGSSTTRFAVGECNTAIVWKLAGNTWSVAWNGYAEELSDITPVSAKSIWAVGTVGSSALLVHWNGKTWSSAPVPTDLSDDIWLAGVIRVPGTQTLWAVGGVISDPDFPVAAYYNGSTWSRVDVPGWLWGDLFSVAASSATNLYAVGGNWDVEGSTYQTGDAGCTVPTDPNGDGCPATTLIERYH